jgi:alpha-tubulin suppressor-like RCC1 family protein
MRVGLVALCLLACSSSDEQSVPRRDDALVEDTQVVSAADASDAASDEVVIRDTPSDVDTGTSGPAAAAVEVSCGQAHTCGRSSTGDVRCWGNGFYGELGTGVAMATQLVPTSSVVASASQVSAGNVQTCALVGGRVWCWGQGLRGLLGDGMLPGPSVVSTPTAVPGLSGILQVGSGAGTVCALTGDRHVVCWGSSSLMQLGYPAPSECSVGSASVPCSVVPTPVEGVEDVADVSFGAEHACIRTQKTATALCWGANNFGQLGDGTTVSRWQAKPVPLPGTIRSIRAGSNRSCAILTTGDVYCWGLKATLPVWTAITTPTLVTGFSGKVKEVAPGGSGSCALIEDGSVQCWGDVVEYVPGKSSSKPVTIAGVDKVVSLCNPTRRVCAVRATGEIYCWGERYLGDGSDWTVDKPQKVTW